VAGLVGHVGRGLLVTDNWYTRVLDPRTLIVTGRQNLRFTQSYPEALAQGAVLGVGTHCVALPSGWGIMAYRAPALHLALELHRQRLGLTPRCVVVESLGAKGYGRSTVARPLVTTEPR
jgi:hypothetical protein